MKIYENLEIQDIKNLPKKELLKITEIFICTKKEEINNIICYSYEVYNKNSKNYKLLGTFPSLKLAIGYTNYIKDSLHSYEYYVNKPKVTGDTVYMTNLEMLGQLCWELCAVSNGYHIYKRKKIVSHKSPYS